jgi:hypothetical protein
MTTDQPLSRFSRSNRSAHRWLDDTGEYLCPICRHGQISPIVLMDAFSCNFCRHIFTANFQEQVIRVEDASTPAAWRWTGHNWQLTTQVNVDLSITVWLMAIVLVILPSSLVWLSTYLFPPLPGSSGNWIPAVWIGLTFCLHFLFVAWLLLEHYQVPFYVLCKVQARSLLGRR